MAINIPNDHICNLPTFFIPRASKIYPKLDFWFENIPSGNPGGNAGFKKSPGRVDTAWEAASYGIVTYVGTFPDN
jgi:hypothetical protein